MRKLYILQPLGQQQTLDKSRGADRLPVADTFDREYHLPLVAEYRVSGYPSWARLYVCSSLKVQVYHFHLHRLSLAIARRHQASARDTNGDCWCLIDSL